MAASMEQHASVICSIYFKCLGSDGQEFVGQKVKMTVPFLYKLETGEEGPHHQLKNFIKHIDQYCNISNEALSRGLGKNVEIKIARLDKRTKPPQAFHVPTQQSWETENSTGRIKDGITIQGKGLDRNI